MTPSPNNRDRSAWDDESPDDQDPSTRHDDEPEGDDEAEDSDDEELQHSGPGDRTRFVLLRDDWLLPHVKAAMAKSLFES